LAAVRLKEVAALAGVALAVLGAAAVMVRANAGPPGSFYWRKLPENLNKGAETRGGLDIEIVPGDSGSSRMITPSGESASSTALAMAAGDGIAAPSPAAFWPNVVKGHGTG